MGKHIALVAGALAVLFATVLAGCGGDFGAGSGGEGDSSNAPQNCDDLCDFYIECGYGSWGQYYRDECLSQCEPESWYENPCYVSEYPNCDDFLVCVENL